MGALSSSSSSSQLLLQGEGGKSSSTALPPGSTSDPLRHVFPSVQVSAGTESRVILAVISDSKPSSHQTGGRGTLRPGTVRAPLPHIRPSGKKLEYVCHSPSSFHRYTRSSDALRLRGAHYFIRRASLSGEDKAAESRWGKEPRPSCAFIEVIPFKYLLIDS